MQVAKGRARRPGVPIKQPNKRGLPGRQALPAMPEFSQLHLLREGPD
jgi:hypothetical protein